MLEKSVSKNALVEGARSKRAPFSNVHAGFRSTMKRNLNDYKKEMQELEARSERVHEKASPEVNHTRIKQKEPRVTAPLSMKWARLMPGLMAILMAILTLIFLIVSEALKKH
ncbi:MAG: hypothetical protein ABSG75_10470 [Syntrophales bacterium]